ncbi:ParA family protein [Paludisphaera mucosa]|uniref:ParA family protein n=1 Tax=Paludisphaera mucosa TaxID=3030827 RepID=A0ABT6FL09_9BACT|nr:ParA family protein [Paludisphaera mucosa]MDG3008258.1 ParA family protein [Paludisphaera mucosa]
MAIITALNQKGGVGKTSTCYHLAGALALGGRRVLLVDNDPQASLTQGFLGPQATRALDPGETIAAVYQQEAMADQVVRATNVPGIDLLAGSRAAGSFNVPDPHLVDWPLQTALRDFLADVADRYDVVMIDCPPNLHLASWTSLVASDALLVPLQPEDFGAQGIADVQESIDRVVAGPNPDLLLLGFLVTMSNPRLSVHKGFEQLLRTHYGDAVFTTTVPISTDYKEAIVQRQPVAQYKPKGAATKVMKALGEEIFARLAAAQTPRAAGEAA